MFNEKKRSPSSNSIFRFCACNWALWSRLKWPRGSIVWNLIFSWCERDFFWYRNMEKIRDNKKLFVLFTLLIKYYTTMLYNNTTFVKCSFGWSLLIMNLTADQSTSLLSVSFILTTQEGKNLQYVAFVI